MSCWPDGWGLEFDLNRFKVNRGIRLLFPTCCGLRFILAISDYPVALLIGNLNVLMHSLYCGQAETEWLPIGKAVRRGCIVPPYLFNLYAECITQKN